MASQGGRLTVEEYKGKRKLCDICKKHFAKWSYTCSPNFFELIYGEICDFCKKKCEECTAKNKPVKSALD